MFNRVINQHCSRQWLGIEQEKCTKSMNFGNRCWWISFTLNCVTTGRYHYQWDSQWVTGKQSILTGIRYRILEYLLSPWCGRTHQVVVRRRTCWITPNLKPTIGVDFTDDSYLISRSDARIFLIISQNKMTEIWQWKYWLSRMNCRVMYISIWKLHQLQCVVNSFF